MHSICLSSSQTLEKHGKERCASSGIAHSVLFYLASKLHLYLPEWWTCCVGGAHTARHSSAYCDVMVEQLLLPIAEAALPLEETAQQSCMVLCTCILLAEYRRAIISNTHAYKYVYKYNNYNYINIDI